MKSTKRTFTVGAILKLWMEIDIKAESLAAAVEQSHSLQLGDFISETTVDGNLLVIQVYDGENSTTKFEVS